MKQKNDKITTISEDIRQIVKNAYGEKFELQRLCNDHHDPILFSDKKPVLEITQDECIGIFASNINHYFLPPQQAYRLGCYCKLPASGIIALMLKAEWEQSFSEMFKYTLWNHENWNPKLKDREQIKNYIQNFQPDSGEIVNLFVKNKSNINTSSQNQYIEFIINDLMVENTFLLENKSVCILYPENGLTEKTLMYSLPESERERYFQLKQLWKSKSDELEELLFLFERKKRLSLNLENKYYRTFGNYELIKSNLSRKVEMYNMITKINKFHPEFSYRELITLAGTRMSETNKKSNELRYIIARSKNCWVELFCSESGSFESIDFVNSYKLTCKKLLKKIYFLLHPDNPNYFRLSEQKKERLNHLWLLLMKNTKDEIYSYSPNMLLYHLPDYEKLVSIYNRACTIIGITPDDIEPGDRLEFMIKKGTSINGITEFLENEIKGLEQHLAYLEIAQEEYTFEEQTQFYRSALKDINGHTERLKNETLELKHQISILKQLLSNGFLKL